MQSSHKTSVITNDSPYMGRIDPVTRMPFKPNDQIIICPITNEALLINSLSTLNNHCPFCKEALAAQAATTTAASQSGNTKQIIEKKYVPPAGYEESRRNYSGILIGIAVASAFFILLFVLAGGALISYVGNSGSSGSGSPNSVSSNSSSSNLDPSIPPTSIPDTPPTRTPRPANTATSVVVPASNSEQTHGQAKISCENKVYFVNLRRTPGISGKGPSDSIYEVPCGETVVLLGESKKADGLTWWKVSWNGYTGWIADHTKSGKTILIFDQ